MAAPDRTMNETGLAVADATLEKPQENYTEAEVDATHAKTTQDRGDSTPDDEDRSDVEKASLPPQQEQSPRDIHGIKWVLAVASVLISAFLFALDNTIVADIQPAIVEEFGQVSKLAWLSVGFLVAGIGTNLFWGKLYSQFDAKYLYLITVFLFEAGSAICGAANSMDLLIFGRALCGTGGVGLYAGVMTLLSVTTTEHERPLYLGFTGLTWGLGTVLGPIIGGAFTSSNAGWRWGFYINLVLGGILAPAWIFLLPRYDPRRGVPFKQRIAEIDLVGAVLIFGAMLSGVMAINFGGTTYAWNSGTIIGLFCTSGVLFIIIGFQQSFCILTTKERRIFPIEFLRSRTMILLFVGIASASSSIFIPIYFIPLYFQFTRGASAIAAGVHLLPYVILLVIFCMANGALMGMFGYYQPWYLGGGIFTVIGSALLYTVTSTTSSSRIYGYSVLAAIGGGSFVQAGFSVAQATVGAAKIPEAIGFMTLGQLAGGTISLAIANSVFLNGAAEGIAKLVPSASRATIFDAISGDSGPFLNSLGGSTKAAVLRTIVNNMDKTYILAITAGALTVVSSLFMKREKIFLKAGGAG